MSSPQNEGTTPGEEPNVIINFDEIQRRLMIAISHGNMNEVKGIFDAHPQFSTKISKSSQTDILAHAIKRNLPEILEILLSNNLKGGNSALFNAVREGSKECVEVILKHIDYNEGNVGPETVLPGGFINPLMLAVKLEQYDVIDLLVQKGYRVIDPDPEDIITDPFSEKYILQKIHYHRARANPLYIAYTYLYDDEAAHPLLEILIVTDEMLKMKNEFFEFESDYKDLSEELDKYAFNLFELACKTHKEIRDFTDFNIYKDIEQENGRYMVQSQNEEERELSFLNFAIHRGNVKFVAHIYNQLHLNQLLYRDIYTMFPFEPDWRKRKFVSKIGYFLRHTLLLPFFMMFYMLCYLCKEPKRPSFCKKLKSPFVKFLSHTGSFLIFVTLLVLSSFQETLHYNIAHAPTAIVTIGTQRYFEGRWNCIPVIMVVLFLLSFVIRFIAYAISSNHADTPGHDVTKYTPTDWYKLMLASNAFFSFAMVFSFLHLSSAFQVSDAFGPLQLSLYKIFIDVLKFMVFFFTLFMAFAFSLKRLYSHYTYMQNHLYKGIKSGKINTTKEADTEHAFSDISNTLSSFLWSMFGMTDINSFDTNHDDYEITKIAGHTLFSLFLIMMVIIGINMLIAMMSKSFQTYAEITESSWKMSRTRMWMDWVDHKNTVPPPYSIFKNLYTIIKLLCPACVKNLCKRNGNLPEEIEMDDVCTLKIACQEQERRKTLRELIQQYLSARKNASKNNKNERRKEQTDRMLNAEKH